MLGITGMMMTQQGTTYPKTTTVTCCWKNPTGLQTQIFKHL